MRPELLLLEQGLRRPVDRSRQENERYLARKNLTVPDSGRFFAIEAGFGGCRREKLLYSRFIRHLTCVRIPFQRVNGPAEFLLLSEVGAGRLIMGSEGMGGGI